MRSLLSGASLSLCGTELRKTRKRLRLELEKTGGEGPGTKAAQYLHKTAEVRAPWLNKSMMAYTGTLLQTTMEHFM
jgi:hypothetical protein